MGELVDGIESLRYWRDRSQRLPWYRRSSRREAREMVERWEGRVASALVAERNVSLGARASAALLVAGTRLQRLRIGRWLKALALAVMLTLALPLLLFAYVLTQLF